MNKHVFIVLLTLLTTITPLLITCNNKADISAIIADIKYNQGTLKILELGGVPSSNFTGHEKLYGEGKIWENLWIHLASHGLPIWYVGEELNSIQKQKQIAYETFYALGGKCFSSILQLKSDPIFKEHMNKNLKGNGDDLSDYHGIIVFRRYKNKQNEIDSLKKECPHFIYLNDAVAKHVNNKHKTSLVFNEAHLNDYRPQWEVYTKKFNHELSDKIAKNFTPNLLVIKPLNCANGWGVIITNKRSLNATLNLILNYQEVCATISDKSYSQWAQDKNSTFLIEEFVESEPLKVDDKTFDPTLRMIFALTHNKGISNIEFLGSYWKLPALSLEEKGSLTQKHKSKIIPNKQSSEKVSTDHELSVQSTLRSIMPRLYRCMLKPLLSINHI